MYPVFQCEWWSHGAYRGGRSSRGGRRRRSEPTSFVCHRRGTSVYVFYTCEDCISYNMLD